MKSSILLFLSFSLLAAPPARHTRMNRLATATITAPDPSMCISSEGVSCYTPQQLQNAYGLAPLLSAGYDGKGQTIVIIESFGSPTIKADLKAFDAAFNLPDPPSFQKCWLRWARSPLIRTDNDPGCAGLLRRALDVQ